MHSRTSFFSCEKLVPRWSQLYSVQVSRASFSYEFLGRRTWVVCHGLNANSAITQSDDLVMRWTTQHGKYTAINFCSDRSYENLACRPTIPPGCSKWEAASAWTAKACFIPFADRCAGGRWRKTLWDSLTMCAVPQRSWAGLPSNEAELRQASASSPSLFNVTQKVARERRIAIRTWMREKNILRICFCTRTDSSVESENSWTQMWCIRGNRRDIGPSNDCLSSAFLYLQQNKNKWPK